MLFLANIFTYDTSYTINPFTEPLIINHQRPYFISFSRKSFHCESLLLFIVRNLAAIDVIGAAGEVFLSFRNESAKKDYERSTPRP